MKNHFSLLAFLCKIPSVVLEQYLGEVGLCEDGLGRCIPWETIHLLESDRHGLALVRQAILAAASPVREQILQDFMEINEMADDRGVAALVASGQWHLAPAEIHQRLAGFDGSHAKAFVMRNTWPKLFCKALRYRRVDAIPELRWFKTGWIEGAVLNIAETAQEQLAHIIGQHYRQQGRGRGCCQVDVEERGHEVYVFVYPEDYGCRRWAFNAQHELIVETGRPVFEIVFVFNRQDGTLDVFYPGTKSERHQVVKYFGRVMLGVNLYPEERKRNVLNLEPLKYRGFRFPLRPEDRILSVRMTEIWLRKRNDPDESFCHYGSACKTDPDACYNAMDDGLNLTRLSLEQVEVSRVRLKIFFRGQSPSARPMARTITLATPNIISITRSDPYYLVMLDVLKRWGLDAATTVDEPVSCLGAA